MTGVTVPSAARMLLDRSRASLLEALAAGTIADRHSFAYLAARHARNVVIDVRGNGGSAFAWHEMRRVAPELAPWASRFDGIWNGRLRHGRGWSCTQREADDLLRDAEAFHHVVEESLGLPWRGVLPGVLPACGGGA